MFQIVLKKVPIRQSANSLRNSKLSSIKSLASHHCTTRTFNLPQGQFYSFSNQVEFKKLSSLDLRCARFQHTKADSGVESDFTVEKDDTQMSSSHVPSFYDRFVFPEPPDLISEEEHNAVISKVNECLQDPGRLFAIITLSGQQFRITTHDLVLVKGYIPAENGTKIRLEKVNLVGGQDFTLIGKPLLKRSCVKVEAVVIEKTPSADMIIKKFLRRRRHERTYKFNTLFSVLRIVNIEVSPNLE